jgi:4-hydroxybenzoate polyprenyltransferase
VTDSNAPPGSAGKAPALDLSSVLALCRVSNLPTVWMNVLTAAALCGAELQLIPTLQLMLSLSAFYCGGMALNDLFDLEWDTVHQPFRPIPAGRISVANARRITWLLFVLAFGLLGLAPKPGALLPGLVLLALIVLYDRIHKEFAGAVFIMAGTRAMVFVVTSWALVGSVSAIVFVVAGAQLLYTVLVTAVARHENTRQKSYGFPLIPRMIAGMSLLDGVALALILHPAWLAVGVLAAGATHIGQRYVRGD